MKYLLIAILLSTSLFGLAQNPEVIINTNASSVYPNEPSVCINRKNPDVIVAGANIDNHYVSLDGGKTWETKQIKTSYGVWGDPVLHSDENGNIYFVHLSKTPNKKEHYGHIDRIVVQTSEDGGKTFNDGAYTGLNGSKMQDKPWISTDDVSDRFRGNAYLTWTEFDLINSKKKKHHSRIRFSKSSDTGKSWSDAITISDTVGDAVDDDHTLEGATTAISADGSIYCVWAGHNKLYFDKSSDGGNTWGKDKVIFNQESGWALDIPHVYRSNGMPFLAIDNSNGKYAGRLYLTWGDVNNMDANVYVAYSDDEGSTWSTPKQLGIFKAPDGKSQFLPNIAVDPTTGNIVVAYFNRYWSKNNVFSDVYVSLSTDGGGTFKNHRINEKLSNHADPKQFSGDYIDVDYYNGKISVVWNAYNEGKAVIFNKTFTQDDLDRIPPIYNVGDISIFMSETKKKPVFYIAATVPVELELVYYRNRFWTKKLKIKSTETLHINHRPGMEGYGELKIESRQKRRLSLSVFAKADQNNNVVKKVWTIK